MVFTRLPVYYPCLYRVYTRFLTNLFTRAYSLNVALLPETAVKAAIFSQFLDTAGINHCSQPPKRAILGNPENSRETRLYFRDLPQNMHALRRLTQNF